MEEKKIEATKVENYDYLKPPKEAHLYIPTQEQTISGKEKKIIRWYFDGDVQYTEFEMQRLQKLKDHLVDKKKQAIIDGWPHQKIFRELQGNQFDNKKCTKDIEDFNDWIQTVKHEIDDDIKKFIESGFMYIAGRDHRYRPVIVMNIYKLDPKVIGLDVLYKGVDFMNKLIIEKMMIPGQIENWVIIMDLNGAALSQIPMSAIKSIISYSSKHYKSRLYRLYMVNTTSAITTTWKAVKFFLEEFTAKKINILKESVPAKMFEHVNKSQVPQKFGGTLPEVNYWPPKLNDAGPFNVEGEDKVGIITPQEYKQKVESGYFKDGVVCQELL